ncbi:hypothetical protein V3I05_06600 [Helicobacter mastomyrinus]|uniref:Uncharacterized protein n=1 Tax=Helicobacter mastomyrinus TaxID=287948 RepID=A0ABZ3F2I4_9HELI
MNEYQKAYIALSRELLFSSSPLVITPKNPYKTTKSLYSSLECKIFFDKEKDVIYIFTYNGDVFDCKDLLQDINNLTNQNKQDLQNYNISIFLESTLLTGGNESKSLGYECYFGTLDSKDSNLGLDESKPIYHLIGEIDSNSMESTSNNKDSNNSLSTLQIFLNGNTLTLLNYSLLDSSLNIKLECNSKESKEILEREQIQREQIQRDSNSIDSLTSTAMLHPILEDDEIKCPHGGVVQLKSNLGKSITDKNIPFILETDLLHSPIIGCTNNIAGVPIPCTQVALILPSSRGLKKHNGDYPIMQDLVSSGVFSDKGVPLICTPKANSYKINAPNPTHTKNIEKEALKAQIEFHKPILRLHYKICPSQKDNLPIYRIKLNDSIIESNNDIPLDVLHIDIAKDTQALDVETLNDNSLDSNLQDILSKIYSSLKQTYAKDYLYQYLSLQLDSNALILILLIPQSLPKLFKEPYKNYKHKDYGIGKYHYLYNYCTFTAFKIEDSMQVGLDSYPSNATILTLHTPYKTQRLELQLASGLDSVIESDREQTQQIIDSLLTLQVVNGGYRQKYWGFGEEIQENLLQADIDKENRESKETQEKEKQITEIYFSYGEDKIRLNDISRHSQDINLHIKTQGYEEGERLDLTLEFQEKTFQISATIRNNQATILNIFNES